MAWFSWTELIKLWNDSFVLSLLGILSLFIWGITGATVFNHFLLKKKGIDKMHEKEIFLFSAISQKTISRRIKKRILQSLTLHCKAKHYRGVQSILLLSAVAPLLGLLGTVEGMIETFNALAHTGVTDTSQLTSGISNALVTTQAGLLVAISGVFAGGVLYRKEKKFHQRLKLMMS